VLARNMDAPWQLAWVRGRLVPRWIVEQAAGHRPKCVHVSFVDTSPQQTELVIREISERLGRGWQVEAHALRARDAVSAEGSPFDLVWAFGASAPVAWEDRACLIYALSRRLAPGGCIIVEPSESVPPDADLCRCSAPGMLLNYAWAEAPAPLPAEPPAFAVRSDRELRALERENIVRALDQAAWKVSGPGGAAELLGIHPSTLRDRMRAFGISREP
jgi:hypothetical protein